MLDQALEWLFEKIHGLGFAATILAALLAWAAAKERPGKELLVTLAIWAVTLTLFSIGGRLDRILYDPVFGVRGLWRSALDSERAAVRDKFAQLDWTINQIQEASRSLFEHSSAWDEHVKFPYEISKASRTFVIPLLLLFIYEIAGWPWGSITREFRNGPLGRPEVIAGLWLVTVSLYVGLRVHHNRALYKLVAEAEILTPADFGTSTPLALLTDEVRNRKEPDASYRFVCLRLDRQGYRKRSASQTD